MSNTRFKLTMLTIAICTSLIYGISSAVLASIGDADAAVAFAMVGLAIVLPLFLIVLVAHKKGS